MTTVEQTESTGTRPQPAVQLFTVAWLAAVVGFALELLSALGAFALQGGTSPQVFFAGLAQRVSWSTIVCVGLAFAKAFAPANPGASAWAGMLAAPAAFTIARAAHKGLGQALGLAVASPPIAIIALLTTLKALEYGVLGAWLARYDERGDASGRRYAGAGLAVGVGFGGLTLVILAIFSPRAAPPAEWLARGLNEVLFPIGCSLVLYAASLASRRTGG